MKKIMNIFVLVAAAAMALASCQKKEMENPAPQEYEYTFFIGNADTKATIGETCVEWESGDKLGSFTKSDNGYSIISVTDGVASFSVYSSGGLSVGDNLYFYYPYSSDAGTDKTAVSMSISTSQNGKDAMPMASLPFTVTTASGENNTPYAGEIKMANLGSVIEFNVYTETEEYASEIIESVTFEANENIAGAFTFDLTAVDYSDEETFAISGYEEKTVVVSASENLVVGTNDAPAVLKMVVAPGSYKGNVVVKTNAATYTFPMNSATVFSRSAIKPLGLKLRADVREVSAPETYGLVEVDGAFENGGKYILAFKDGYDGTYAFINSDGTEGTAIKDALSVESSSITNPNAKYVFTAIADGSGYKFQNSVGGYIYTKGDETKLNTNNTSPTVWTAEYLSASRTYKLSAGRYISFNGTDKAMGYAAGNFQDQVANKSELAQYAGAISVFKLGYVPVVTPIIIVTETTKNVQSTDETVVISYSTDNIDGSISATVTSDEGEMINGNPTVAEGNVTVSLNANETENQKTATITLSYEGAENVVVTITQAAKPAEGAVEWVSTSFANLKEGDQVVIVSTKSSSVYAMTNNNGTGSAPSAKAITYSSDKLTNEPEESVIWYVGVDGENRIFYADAGKTKWLYCTGTNNGVRVGTNTNKTFKLTSEYLYHNGTSRYIGIYNNSDWRCYTTINSNITGQTFDFFVKTGGSGGETPESVQLEMSDVECTAQTESTLTFTWTEVANATGYEVYFDSVSKGTTTELTYTADNLTAGTSHTIVVKAVGDGMNYTTSEAKTCTASTTVASGGEDDGDLDSQVTISKSILDISGTTTNGTKVSTMKLDDVITVNASTSGNNGKVYEKGKQWRLYQSDKGTLTVSAIEGFSIMTVKFTYTVENTGILMKGSVNVTSGTTDTVDASTVTYSVGNTGTATNGQVRVTAIEVVYQAK